MTLRIALRGAAARVPLALGLLALVVTGGAIDGGCHSQARTCTCPTVIAQVCGTDGHSYGNPCEADCAGVTVARTGACDADAGADDAAGGAGGAHAGGGGAAGAKAGTGGAGGSACVGPAPVGCCLRDADCAQGGDRCITAACATNPAHSGVCERLLPNDSNLCWTDADCYGGTCAGAQLCPCGAACLVADQPGECTP